MPGPIPNVSTVFVGAGNAAGLFPEITPTPTPSPGPEDTNPVAERSVNPAGQALGVVTNAPVASALGLIALAVAFLLVMTRLSVRRRKKEAAGIFPEITPAPTPGPGPEDTKPAAERSVDPAGQAGVFTSAPARPALGLIALAVAFLLVMTRLFVRRRTSRRGPGA
jgi:F0F1-type ATP synthase membrane subunit c/vacuolar-type H+-ATPase subunit K